ncbi:hypothetical protein LAY57_33225 [Argonema antarcticum A004/B2]|nr:hypothetical protein [Argonema antarcticum A004/B2]
MAHSLAPLRSATLSDGYPGKVHRSLERNYSDTKDEMEYDELLDVVKEVMSDYPEWSWNGQRWIKDEE